MFDLSKFSLKGKAAVVTGGGRGIGKAIAQGFAEVRQAFLRLIGAHRFLLPLCV